MERFTSVLLWSAGAAVTACWYPVLIGLSYVVPMSRLHGFAQGCFRLSLRACGIRLVVEGLEHLDPGQGTLFLGNHVNIFDPFVFVAAVPQWVVAVEHRPNFRVPVYGWLISRWGNIPIDRDDLSSALQTMETVKARLQEGDAICMMPEGTRSRSGELGDYRIGAFRLAIEAKARVLPFALHGLRHIQRTGSWRLRSGTVTVIFTPPIDAGAYEKADLQALSDRVRSQMTAALEAHVA